MNLKEIQKKRPDSFLYKRKKFVMTYYSMSTTHKDQVSDSIIWTEVKNNYYIEYDMGNILYANMNGEIISEIKI